MKKTERKNLLSKLVVILLMVMLISTSLLSRTLAKYVTSGTLINENARVAKWGVVLTPSTNTLFSTTYTADDGTYAAGGNTVASINSNLVVAPGTKGTSVDFTVTGTPEVATRVQLVDNGSSISGWTLEDGSAYEPVKWTLKKGTTTVLDGGTFAQLLSELTTSGQDFAPGTDLSEADNGFVIEWEWPFDSNDVNDTYLGDKPEAPTITLNLNITITQID